MKISILFMFVFISFQINTSEAIGKSKQIMKAFNVIFWQLEFHERKIDQVKEDLRQIHNNCINLGFTNDECFKFAKGQGILFEY